MKGSRKHTLLWLVFLGGAFTILVFVLLLGRLSASIAPNAMNQVEEAWALARQSSSYGFSVDVFQKTVPLPKVTNIGRQSREEVIHIEGQANNPEQKLELSIWSGDGGNLNKDDAIQLRMEQGKAQARQPGGEWEVLEEYTSLYAPEGDMLAYLAAARQVENQGNQTRNGASFTRYTFEIDGPAFAAYLRTKMEQRMQENGELPAGMQLDLPHMYLEMEGEGELWVGEDGLPVRQLIYLRFPNTASDQVEGRIDAAFSDYVKLPEQSIVLSPLASILGSEGFQQAGMAIILLLVFLVLLSFRRSKSVYVSVVILVIVSMLLTPLLEGAQVKAYTDRQLAQQEEAEALQQEEQVFMSLRERLVARINAIQVSEQVQQTLNKESLGGTPTLKGLAYDLPKMLEEDNGEDSDADGLTDYQEQHLGTDPQDSDTDGDKVSDRVEVQGFEFNGKRWYTNPLAYDTNDDGMPDLYEYADPVNGVPADSDNDLAVPDLFTDDNDSDGVPDARDLSPNQTTKGGAAFTRTRPFVLKVDQLETGLPTYVEFQLRPVDVNHLWYAQNVLDWPEDRQGQIQDGDGKTYADVFGQSGASGSATNAENGDMKLIPLLEIRLSGIPDNLPTADTLEKLYGITYINRSQARGEKTIYVPLQPVIESDGGARLAFYGKMLYQPGETWNNQEVRLVWVVQALVDICQTYDDETGLCTAYSDLNKTQIVQVYYDDWFLTGLNIQENWGYTQGIVWEDPDPQVDEDLTSDDILTLLTYQLDKTFLVGSDADQNGIPDITIGEIQRRFDHLANDSVPEVERWNIPDKLHVYKEDFTHADAGLSKLTAKTTEYTTYYKILDDAFGQRIVTGQTVTPTLLILSEERFRTANLDDSITTAGFSWTGAAGNQLSVDMSKQGPSQLAVTERWQSYRFDGTHWTALSVAEQWDEMLKRYQSLYLDEADQQAAGQKRLLLAYYNLALYQAQSNLVGRGGVEVSLQGSSDAELAEAAGEIGGAILENLGTRLAKRAARESAKDLLSKSPESLAGRSYSRLGMGLEFTVIGMNLLSGLLGDEIGENTAKIIDITGNFMLAGALVLDDIVGGYKAFAAAKEVADLSTSAKMLKFAKQVDVKGAAGGLILDLIVTWGVFAAQYLMGGGSDMSALAFHALIASAFVSTLIAVTIFLISILTCNIVAIVIEILLLIIDAFLMIFGESTLSEKFADFLNDYSMIADPDVRILQTDLIHDIELGLVAPSRISFTARVKEVATHKDPDSWMTKLSNEYWMPDVLYSSAVKSNLTSPAQDLESVETTHGSMNSQWWTYFDHYYTFGINNVETWENPMYRVEKYQTHSIVSELNQPGINIPLPVHLNIGYDVPYVSCMYYFVWLDCDLDYQAGETSLPLGDSIILDVLPATLDGFYQLLSPERGYKLAWDDKFPVLRDADGDGLLSAAYGGSDPNDATWDSDGDGLSDAYELERRQIAGSAGATSLLSKDTDYDGLCDDQEIQYGTHPNQRDSDGDGLLDSEEVFHPNRCGSTTGWSGGWDYAIDGLVMHVTSDPLNPDTDGDGLDDKAEFTLLENPRAWTENPMLMTAAVNDEDRIVAPGQSLVYTVTLQNDIQSETPLFCLGDLFVELPPALGGGTLKQTMNIAQGSSQFLQREVVVGSQAASDEQVINNSFAGQMNDGDLNTYWTLTEQDFLSQYVGAAHSYAFPPYASILAYPNPTSTYAYATADLSRPISNETLAHVNFRQLVDSFSQPTNVYASDTQFPRRFLGGYPPGLACNNDGHCLVLWERSRYDPTALLHLDEITLTTSGNIDGSGDSTAEVEFWGYLGYRLSRVKTLSWSFGPENTTGYLFYRGLTQPAGIVKTFLQGSRDVNPCLWGGNCTYGWFFNISQGASLSIVEKDCNFWGCQWDGSGTPSSYTFVDFDPFHPNYRTWDRWSLPHFHIDVSSDPDGWADIGVTAFYRYGDGIYASLLDENNANISGLKMVSQVVANAGNTFGQPAAASDGQNFLAVYARKYADASGNVKNGIFAQVVLDNGNAMPAVQKISDTSVSFEQSWPKVIWMQIAKRYLVIWNDGGTRAALVNQSGIVEWQGILTGATVNRLEQVPDVAYNAATGEALMVYLQENKLYSLRLRLSDQAMALEKELPREIERVTPSSSEIRWPAVAYEPFSSGWVVSWIDRPSGYTDYLNYIFMDDQGQVLQHKEGSGDAAVITPVQKEKYGTYQQQDLACRNLSTAEVAHCSISGIQNYPSYPQQFSQTFTLDKISPFKGSCNPPTAALSIWVDSTGPEATIALQEDAAYAFEGIVTIGGEANDLGDMASGVGEVWISTDGGANFARAEGAESWAYNWEVQAEDGPVTLQVKAKDKVGNWGPVNSVTINLDRSAPEELSLIIPGDANPVQAIQDENGTWRLQLVIQAADSGSGVASVSASLEPLGSGWQDATLAGGNWTLAYPFSPLDPDSGAVAQPTGAYTVRLTARDQAGNTRQATVPWLVQVDNTPPEVVLTFPNPFTQVISQTVEVTGVISDTGETSSGVGQVEIAFAPAGQAAETWMMIAPDEPGAITSAWGYPLPDGLDGLYQIWLRGSDRLGNRREAVLAGQFLVEIDTSIPETGCTMAYRGAGSAAQTEYHAWAQDFNLSQDVTGLLETGSTDLLPGQFVEKFFYDDPWYVEVISDTTRLERLEFSGILNGHVPLSISAGDMHGHSILSECQETSAPPPALSSAVLEPANGSAITWTGPITISGGANATASLSSLTLTANGLEIYSTTWITPGLTDATWSTSWLPVDGVYELIPVVTDVNGQVQTELQPVLVIVDRLPPDLTLDSNLLNSQDRISHNRVWLTGTASDNLELEVVEVSADNGVSWQPASLDGESWRFAWSAGDPLEGELDGVTKQVSIRAVDRAGLIAQIDPWMTVDLRAPAPVTMTLSLDAGAGLLSLERGQTVREAHPTLYIDWTASSDGGGAVTYWAGWSPEKIVKYTDLQQVQDAYQYAQLVEDDLQVLYAHLILRDAAGNERHIVDGPIYIDRPGPPDLVSDLFYRAWMDETCNLIGADYEVTHYAAEGASLNEVQKLYASWDETNLRLTYTGASWDNDGDLFVYLDTASGGAVTAYDPYGSGPTIQFPAGFAADKLVFVEDSHAASLLTWNGSSWDAESLPAGQYRYEAETPGYTDLLLSWASLGNPGSAKLLALASEEDTLRTWAVVPEKNPLNSERAVDTLAVPYLDRPFTLRSFVTLNRVGACPNGGQVAGPDLHFSLSAEPSSMVVGYLADDLASLLTPGNWLDNDLDGQPDIALPVDLSSAWVGEGQPILYTLTYTNTGTVDAQDVIVNLSARGLQPTGEGEIVIGTIGAGEGGTVIIPAAMLTGVLSGELRLEISDARHGAFEWLWSLHRVDKEPPQGLTIESPALYVRSGPNLITGRVYDPSGVASVVLSIAPLGGPSEVVSCLPPASGEDLWTCTWTPPAGFQAFEAQAQASDSFGNTGALTAVTNWTLDDTPPTVSLSQDSQAALGDNILLPGELLLAGSLDDNYSAAAVKVCALAADNPLEICEWARLTPGATPATAAWEAQAPIAGVVDGLLHSITITGFDTAGNPSNELSFEDLYVDLAGPTITISEYHPYVLQAQSVRIVAGLVSDGSGVAALSMIITDPTGNVFLHPCSTDTSKPCTLNGDAWEFTARFDEVGRYALALEAQDEYGNKNQYTPVYVQVVPRDTATDLSIDLAASPEVAISGFPLTYTASIHNAGPGIATGIVMTATLPAELDLASAPAFCASSGSTLECSIPDPLSLDSSIDVQFTLNVPGFVTATLTSEATVGTVTIDLAPENNHDIIFTPVIQPVSGLTAQSDSPTPLGAATTLAATVTTGYPVYYHWDFGDGETGDGAVVNHTYPLDPDFNGPYPLVGVYTATVTASNDYNQMSASTRVEIINLAPVVNTDGLDQITYEDELTWTGYIKFIDQNFGDTHTAMIDWGDGVATPPEELIDNDYGGELLGSHIYADPGVYTVTVTVEDAYGGIGTGTFTITVLHGFLRLCAYADGQDPGVYLYPDARLDCGWNQPDSLTRVTTSGAGSRGYIQIEDGVVVTGSLRSQGQTLISGEEVQLIGGEMAREFDLLTIGNIDSQGNVDLGIRGNVAGNVASRADVYLRAHSFVGGDVYANGEVTVSGSATISGTITEGADLPPVPPITSVNLTLVAGAKDITVPMGGVLALDPGTYRNLTVKKGGTLKLKAGWYTFESITVEQNAAIKIDLARGALLVDVVKTLFMGEGTQMKITSSSGTPDKILFRVGGNTVYLMNGGVYLGTYLALGGQARLGIDAKLTGALYGKAVHVMDRARIIGLPARNLFAITMVNPDLPLGCAERVDCSWLYLPMVRR